MYKILVTTTLYTAVGAAVHTVVIEFETAGAARAACNMINTADNSKRSWGQSALLLFDGR